MPGIDVADILNMLTPKIARKAELELKLIEFNKKKRK